MSYTLRIVVNPYESSEKSEKITEDRNAFLVSRAFPPTSLTTYHGTELNTKLLGVQQVVAFHIDRMNTTNDGLRLPDSQRIFLENLINIGVVKSYSVTDVLGRKVEIVGEEF